MELAKPRQRDPRQAKETNTLREAGGWVGGERGQRLTGTLLGESYSTARTASLDSARSSGAALGASTVEVDELLHLDSFCFLLLLLRLYATWDGARGGNGFDEEVGGRRNDGFGAREGKRSYESEETKGVATYIGVGRKCGVGYQAGAGSRLWRYQILLSRRGR